MWITCQIGAREHYAVPRALARAGELGVLITDFWVPPESIFSQLPGGRRLRDRWHPDLAQCRVVAANLRMFGFEATHRLRSHSGWPLIMERNRLFQRKTLASLRQITLPSTGPPTLFSYSYAAGELFRYAKARGWRTVLGQIDPGPEEERIVAEEHRRYPMLASRWQHALGAYWEAWREEVALADRIIVNSEWSRACLRKEGVPDKKLEIIPLVYQEPASLSSAQDRRLLNKAASTECADTPKLQCLFLGQINLRKGIGRLLDAMRLLKDEAIMLTLVGPSEIDPSAWADLPHVRWVGALPRSEVGARYQEADVFILPTMSDGYALTQLEALSWGLPVIASQQCGNAVEDGKNGWILPDVEPTTIREMLLRVRGSISQSRVVRPPQFSLDDLVSRLV